MKKLLIILVLATFEVQSQEVVRVQNTAAITIQSTAEITIQGGVTLENGSSLTNNGIITIKRNGVSGTADWTDQTGSGYDHGSGTIVFNSTGSQFITSANLFGTIQVDNTGLDLLSTIRASSWLLKSGVVNTGSHSAHVLSTTSTAIDADAANSGYAQSWINGNLRRYISPASVAEYRFPVGGSSRVNIAEMTDLTTDPLFGVNYIDASFGPKPGTDAGLMVSEQGSTYVAVNNGGVWYLTPDASPSSGNYDLLLYFNGFTGLQDNSFGILRRPNASSDAADWQVPAGSSLNPSNGLGRLVSHGYALRNNLSIFNQFGIGHTSFPLPVTLLDFTAKRFNKNLVRLSWTTETEQNNRGFDIERRKDHEQQFTVIGYSASKAINGNSISRLDYLFHDANDYNGISYYRIKQIDRDSRQHYSVIKAVDGLGINTVSVLIWPNPGKGQFSIKLDGSSGLKQGYIVDVHGKLVKEFTIQTNQEINITRLAAGSYTVLIKDAFGKNKNFSEKVLVIRH